jgi:signal transduction histidine kinase
VSLEDQAVVVSQWQNDHMLGLSIIDQGVGLQAKDAVQRQGGAGIGLGLQIADRIVALHQGTVQYAPLANKGTQVLISFPIRA